MTLLMGFSPSFPALLWLLWDVIRSSFGAVTRSRARSLSLKEGREYLGLLRRGRMYFGGSQGDATMHIVGSQWNGVSILTSLFSPPVDCCC